MKEKTFTQSIAEILERDLTRVIDEINQFSKDENIWRITGTIKNSAGNLALHVAGSVNHFVGAILGKSSYQRNRDFEFAAKNLPTTDILHELQAAIDAVRVTMPQVEESNLRNEFPVKLGETFMTVQHFLIHLVSHVNYHLGQINYIRRLNTE